MRHISLFLLLASIALIGTCQDENSRLLNHGIGFHHDVSLLGLKTNDYLAFNGEGFVPKAPINFTGIPDGAIPYLSGDSLAGSGISIDLNGDFSSTTMKLTGGNQPNLRAEGTVAGWVRLGTVANTWDLVGLAAELRIEPGITDGRVVWRKQDNTELMTLSTGSGVFEIKSASFIRLTGKGGPGVSLAALDEEDDLTEATIGDGLNFSTGGALQASVFHGTGAVSGDAGDGQTLVIAYPETLVSGVNTILATVKATGSGSPTGEELSVYVTTESTTGCTLSLGEQLESGESVNISWSVHY